MVVDSIIKVTIPFKLLKKRIIRIIIIVLAGTVFMPSLTLHTGLVCTLKKEIHQSMTLFLSWHHNASIRYIGLALCAHYS